MKKILSTILASSMLLSMVTASFAREISTNMGETGVYSQTLSSNEGDFIMGDGGIITKYTGSGGNVVIPSTIGGRTVYGIGEKAFQNVTSLESITMPSTLERIEAYAFSGCSNLRTVNLNDGVYYIGGFAFEHTTNLSSLWIPSSVTELGGFVFNQCGLTSAYIPETVKTVGERLFLDSPRLKSVIFMADVDELPISTFYGCVQLEDVYLREGIVTIGQLAFSGCTGLKEITLPSTVKTIGISAFSGCTKLETMDMTNTALTYVDQLAFYGCISLTEVVFPYGFSSFYTLGNANYGGKQPFSGCTSLVKVVFPSTVTSLVDSTQLSLGRQPFTDCNPTLVIHGFEGTVAETLANGSSSLTWASRGSVANEHQPTIVPITPPTLPTAPDTATPKVTPPPEITTPQVASSLKMALPSTAKVMVNGVQVNFGAYEIDGFNYFKLTDMSYAISGTSKQFEVTWDAAASAINMKIGNPHILLGTELQGNSGKNETAELFTSPVLKNSSKIDVVAYTINGSSYFQLDTLKGILDLTVGWDGATSTITIETNVETSVPNNTQTPTSDMEVEPEELYADTLAMVRAAADDQTLDFEDYIEIGLAYYLGLSEDNLSRMGYDFVDVNGDNTPELFIGYETNDGYGGKEYNIIGSYTVKDGVIVPYLDCGERFGYFLTKDLQFGYWGWGGAGDNSYALLTMNNHGELEYESYINNLYEFDLEKEFDYIITIENNKPNYENKRIATNTELAEFYRIYEGEKYQFHYTPFIEGTETEEPVLQNFSGQAYVDFPDFGYHDAPDPSDPCFGEVYLHGMSDMKSLCYYLGLDFEYVVADGELLVGHPDCIYAFYLGNIVDPTMKEGDILRLDGSEKVLDVVALTEDAEKRMEAYKNPQSTILDARETQEILRNWLDSHFYPDSIYIAYGFFADLMGEGMVYSPYVGYVVNFNDHESYTIYVNRYYGNMYIELNGNYENDLDTWYGQRFG